MPRFVGWRAAALAVALLIPLVVAVLRYPAGLPIGSGGSGRHAVDDQEDASSATAADEAGSSRPGARPGDSARPVDNAASAAAATGSRAGRGGAGARAGHGSAPGAVPPAPAFTVLAGWPGFAEADREFEGEARDAEWAARTEGRLLGLVAELDGVALNRLEADCRESMCRLLLLHPPDIEPVYSIRQIYDRAGELGLGPVVADTRIEAGEPSKLRVFLRRRAAVSSPR
jgi:hypothetical protein